MSSNSNTTQASSTTTHYGLSQWAAEDLIRREDFNHDLAAIDAALHSQQEACTAAIQEALGQICVQKLANVTLTAEAAALTIDLSSVDLSQYDRLEVRLYNMASTSQGSFNLLLTVNNDSTSGHYGKENNSSLSSTSYLLSATLSCFGSASVEHILEDVDGVLSSRWRAFYVDNDRDSGKNNSSTNGTGSIWKQGGLSSVSSLRFTLSDDDTLKSGARAVVYGWRK